MTQIEPLLADALLPNAATHSAYLVYLLLCRDWEREGKSQSYAKLGRRLGLCGKTVERAVQVLRLLRVVTNGPGRMPLLSTNNPEILEPLKHIAIGRLRVETIPARIVEVTYGG